MSEMTGQQQSSKWVSRLTLVAGLLFTIYLAFLAAKLVWFILEDKQSAIPSQFAESNVETGGTKRVVRAIDRYHLFGEMGLAPVQVEKPKEAPKTKLRLLLKGVFTGVDGGKSGAIIEEIGKSAEYYGIGDSLPGGVRLAEVYADRVLLDRNGAFEALYFDEQDQSIMIAEVERPEPEPSQDIRTPEDFIEEAANRLSENPEQALNSVGLGFAEEGGYVFKGNNPMLSGMNLQQGDVIRSVNGHTLGDIEQDKEMMRTIYQQGSIEVEVVRDGASFFVNYPLN
jgi:general secretion pathway protein C